MIEAIREQISVARDFVATSTFTVANDKDDEVEAAFLKRPHLVDHAAGFLRMEVFRNIESPEEFWLVTYWKDEASYESWHHGHAYGASHSGMPKGLKLVKGSVKVRRMRRICE